MHICDATLTKRLVEFENTESGSLTVTDLLYESRLLSLVYCLIQAIRDAGNGIFIFITSSLRSVVLL